MEFTPAAAVVDDLADDFKRFCTLFAEECNSANKLDVVVDA